MSFMRLLSGVIQPFESFGESQPTPYVDYSAYGVGTSVHEPTSFVDLSTYNMTKSSHNSESKSEVEKENMHFPLAQEFDRNVRE